MNNTSDQNRELNYRATILENTRETELRKEEIGVIMSLSPTIHRISAKVLGLALILFQLPQEASATSYVFDLSGSSAAPLAVANAAGPNFVVNWTGAVLTYNDFSTPDNFTDDVIKLSGAVEACYGTTTCGSTDPFKSKLTAVAGGVHLALTKTIGGTRGVFDLDATIAVDPNRTTGYDNLYAQQQMNIGKLVLPGLSTLPASQITLGLKNNTDLGWAFRLFDENPTGDNQFRIETWMTLSGLLLGGAELRWESRAVEQVFNGHIFATLRGNPPPPPPTGEVPEPATIALLLAGAAGWRKRLRTTDNY